MTIPPEWITIGFMIGLAFVGYNYIKSRWF